MECKIIDNTFNICEKVFESSAEQAVDVDISMPDYCPDIGKILKCQAFPGVLSQNVSADKINIEGITLIRVIYVDDKTKCIRSYEHEQPFSVSFAAKDISDDASVCAETKMDYINCRAVTQRKLDIHGAFTVTLRAYANKEHVITSDAEGASVKLRRRTFTSENLLGEVSAPFILSDTLELANGKQPIGTIVRSEVCPEILEMKSISNKLIVRGEAVLKILYSSDYDQQLENMEYTIPFNQFVDIDGLDDNCKCEAEVDTRNIRLTLKTDSDGEYRLINADIKMFITARGYKQSEISFVSDAYSTEYEMNVESKQINIDNLCDIKRDSVQHRCSVDIPDGAEQIYDVWCCCGAPNTIVSNELTVKAPITVCILAKGANGETLYIEKNDEIVYSSSIMENMRAKAHICVTSCTYTFSGTDKLDIRVTGQISISTFKNETLRAVVRLTPDESKKKNPATALTVYYAQSGESLWDIAKGHNSSVETIMLENEITGDTLSENKMLLISV